VINGIRVPFSSQPVQGFSAILPAEPGSYWIMEDNGYGAKANSAGFLLRMYRVTPNFQTAKGGTGSVAVGDFVQLRDPDQKIPFPLTRPDRLRLMPNVCWSSTTTTSRSAPGGPGIVGLRRLHRCPHWSAEERGLTFFGEALSHTIDNVRRSNLLYRTAMRYRPRTRSRQGRHRASSAARRFGQRRAGKQRPLPAPPAPSGRHLRRGRGNRCHLSKILRP
jgi:hypothetical protein